MVKENGLEFKFFESSQSTSSNKTSKTFEINFFRF